MKKDRGGNDSPINLKIEFDSLKLKDQNKMRKHKSGVNIFDKKKTKKNKNLKADQNHDSASDNKGPFEKKDFANNRVQFRGVQPD